MKIRPAPHSHRPAPAALESLARDCDVTPFKSSGPGGQKKNKTESSVRVRHLPTSITRIATESRSQRRNRELALTRVWEELQRRAAEDVSRQDREYQLSDELSARLGDDLFRELTVVGAPEDVKKKIRELSEVEGLTHIIINIHARDRSLTIKTFRDEIIPAYR